MKYAKAEDIVSNANAPSHWIENFNHMRNISDKKWGYKKNINSEKHDSSCFQWGFWN